jgi:sugar phosphate isomerase/epimerase
VSTKKLDPPNPDQLAINAATLRENCNMRQAVDALRRHRIGGIAPWRDKVAEAGLKDSAKMIRDAGLTVTGYCRAGLFPALERKGRQAALDENMRAIEEAATLGAQCLVIVAGGLPKGSKDLIGAREMVRDGLGEILDHARGCGVPLALEPLHPMQCADRACVNTLRQALDLCDELDSSKGGALGVAVDVYHVWWDPELKAQIERAGEKRILGFHICDWLVPTTDLTFDRGMMGDGVIDIPMIRSWVEAAGYRGMHEAEIFSAKNWWKRDADQVLVTCKMRHESVC